MPPDLGDRGYTKECNNWIPAQLPLGRGRAGDVGLGVGRGSGSGLGGGSGMVFLLTLNTENAVKSGSPSH